MGGKWVTGPWRLAVVLVAVWGVALWARDLVPLWGPGRWLRRFL